MAMMCRRSSAWSIIPAELAINLCYVGGLRFGLSWGCGVTGEEGSSQRRKGLTQLVVEAEQRISSQQWPPYNAHHIFRLARAAVLAPYGRCYFLIKGHTQ